MKKIKLLTPILGLTVVAGGVVPLASCGCSKQETTEGAVPTEGLNIKDVTLHGFKEDFEYKNYTKLIIPSNVKVIDTDAFNGLLSGNCKITTVVIPGNVETIKEGAFADCPNVSVYDFSSFTIDQIYALTVEKGAFGDLTENGIYSYVKMNENWTNVQKEALKNKLLAAGIPNYWLVEQTSGNVEVTNSMEQTAVGGTGTHEMKILGQYDYTFKYTAVVSRIDGTDGVTIETKDVEIDQSFKTIKANTKMATYDSHVLTDGDWVSYKITLFCSYEDETTNETVIKWVQNIETFKLTFETAHVTGLKLNHTAHTFTSKKDTLQLEVTYTPTEPTTPGVTWTSSDPTVATVFDGLVTPLKNGSTVITAASIDNPSITATCTITVAMPAKITCSFLDSSVGKIITEIPKELNLGQPLELFYTTNIGIKVNPQSSATIVNINGVSFKDSYDIDYRAGRIYIPGNLVTGDIQIIFDTVGIPETADEKQLDETDWTKINSWCESFEKGEIGRDEFISKFTVNGGQVITSDNELVGSTIDITINTKLHKARIIDVSHDTISDSGELKDKKAALTFEMVTLLSDSTGESMCCVYDELFSDDYTNSWLRKNLTNNGEFEQVMWFHENIEQLSDTRTVLQMLPSVLQNCLKTVKKEVAILSTGWKPTSYEDKLFPLSYTEMGQSGSKRAAVEGSTYHYWAKNNNDGKRVKKNFNSNAKKYMLASPDVNNDDNFWQVGENGGIWYDYIDVPEYSLSFAFCI